MKPSILPLCAALSFGTGCVITTDRVNAGAPLDAQFYLDWDTRDAVTNNLITCAAAGADTLRVRARNASTGKTYVDLFDCSDYAGKTFSVTAGDYFVTVSLLHCGADADCRSPDVLSTAATVGPLGVWDDGEYDLGQFIFRL